MKTLEVKRHWESYRGKIENLKCHFAKRSSGVPIMFDLSTREHGEESDICMDF